MREKLTLPDYAERKTALTTVTRSFLVEAGAGSGKTSIMAGRVAVLLAGGVEPKHIAAITFTEFSASELLTRINEFVTTLAKGMVPGDLDSAFPDGVSAEHQKFLNLAKKVFDQMTCSTIHGFAQALIKPYPVEANIDPGATIIDPAEADLAFDERYEAWLKRHLSGGMDDGIVAELVLADAKSSLNLIREIADFLRRNRNARAADGQWLPASAKDFAHAVAIFGQTLQGYGFIDQKTADTHRAFAALAATLNAAGLDTNSPPNRALIGALTLPRPSACFTQGGGERQLRTVAAWKAAAKAAGKSQAEGEQAYASANNRYHDCHQAFAALASAGAGELLRRIVSSMDDLMLQWRDYKRAAALLDFDDLLYTAQNLLIQHDNVRRALAKRFRYVLVDEFQDTDPQQIDILWRLCGDASDDKEPNPLKRRLRPGALFLVGDPKQAIYRFRGADVNAYVAARESIGKNSLLNITANFRSVETILNFVNMRFANALSEAVGQPGFTVLSPTRKVIGRAPAVCALDVNIEDEKPKADMRRNAEADRVAELCSRLVGNHQIWDHRIKALRACEFGDIALLAPVGTELWRFEEALEQQGIAVSTQAGKGFFRRQEVQDLIALTRTLADARDTLALGALLRGPLVGLTEGELLDLADGLPGDPGRPDSLPQLDLWTDPKDIKHDLARSVLEKLQQLARSARSTTPYMLLSGAVAMLDVRPQLRQRFKTGPERGLANVDLFLEMARAYDVRGLRAFARDMHVNWEEPVRQVEGRPDAEQQSVALITIHSAKGLEWPIVIPINMTGAPRTETGLMYDRRSGVFSIPVLDVEPAGHTALKSWTEQEHQRERVRLWYVATTRARDLLILPRHAPPLKDASWINIVDLDLPSLPAIDPDGLGKAQILASATAENPQSRAIFTDEAERIAKSASKISWRRPSRDEAEPSLAPERILIVSDPGVFDETVQVASSDVAGGATRGTILHKLMEEVLTGETADTAVELELRAEELLSQRDIIAAADPKSGISPAELAATVMRTLSLPEIQALRPRLIPEFTIFGHQVTQDGESLISGIGDALARDPDGGVEVIVDWKSDTTMDAKKLKHYRSQLDSYRQCTGAKRALLVLMTPGRVAEFP